MHQSLAPSLGFVVAVVLFYFASYSSLVSKVQCVLGSILEPLFFFICSLLIVSYKTMAKSIRTLDT